MIKRLLALLALCYCACAFSAVSAVPSTNASPTTETNDADDEVEDTSDDEEGPSPLVIQLDENEIPANEETTGGIEDLLNVYRLELKAGALNSEYGYTQEHFDANETELERFVYASILLNLTSL